MSVPEPSWIITVLLLDDALALNRAIGIIRRRNLGIASLSIGPSHQAGILRLTCGLAADRSAIDRSANQLRKMVGVVDVLVQDQAECVTREHALIRVRANPHQLAALLDTVALFQASVVEEGAGEIILEATATPPLLDSLLRALEPHGLLEVTRGGFIALARPALGETRQVIPVARISTAIPA